MTKIRAIISDADGTLVNTIYLIRHGQYETTAAYLRAIGVPRHTIPTYETYESYLNASVGGSTRETFEKTLRLILHNQPDILKKINFKELDDSHNPIQDRIAPLYVHPFHGLTELLSWAGEQKLKIGIFTSGSRHHIVRNFGVSLPALGYTDLFLSRDSTMAERFQAFILRAQAVYGMPQLSIVTCEAVKKTKPNPEGILKLVKLLAVAPNEAIALGDHKFDMMAAHAAGLPAIGITHGFGTPAELIEAGAVRVLDNLAALPKLIENHNQNKSRLF